MNLFLLLFQFLKVIFKRDLIFMDRKHNKERGTNAALDWCWQNQV